MGLFDWFKKAPQKKQPSEPRSSRKPAAPALNGDDLTARCRAYLEGGPPAQMVNYVPNSLVEIIIAHGANGEPVTGELREIGDIVLMEAEAYSGSDDPAILAYMRQGADLVAEVLQRQDA